MSLKQRRLLFYSFIFLFLLIAPFALLFATGRTINWSRFEIQKTGSMIIESEPSNASILLNNKRPTLFFNQLINKNAVPKTNTRLTNLAPANYIVRLDLEGYIPWEKKATVRANEVTNIGPIRLFKQTTPKLQTKLDQQQQLLISPDGRTVISLASALITIIQVPERKQINLSIENTNNPSIFWSNDQEVFVLNDSYVINRQGELVANLTENLNFQPSFVRWDNDNRDQIYYVQKNQIYRFTFFNKKNELVININSLLKSGDLYDYKVGGNHIYFVIKKKFGAEIIVLYPGSPKKETTTTLPEGTYHFINDAKNKILLLETQKKDVYLLEQPLPLFFTPRVTLVAKNYAVGWWNKNKVLYATPFEVREWSNNQENLISRFGEAVIGLSQLSKNNEILFATKDSLKIIPTTDQIFSQTITLLSNIEISNILFVNDNNLYFIGKYNDQYGIFNLDF
jgi:hypothetical protein